MPPPLESVNVINRSPSMPNIGLGEPLETIETLVSIASDEDVVHEDLNCKLIPTFENIQERYMMATLSNGVEFNLS